MRIAKTDVYIGVAIIFIGLRGVLDVVMGDVVVGAVTIGGALGGLAFMVHTLVTLDRK